MRVQARAAARAREAARVDRSDIEQVDFMKTIELRRTIHARERGRCFYCLRRIPSRLECLDHVVPRARVGCNSYRNLVSACMECNAQKGERPAEEYLRWLFREHRLGAAELRGRFEALELLAAGKLRADASESGGGRIIALVEARFRLCRREGRPLPRGSGRVRLHSEKRQQSCRTPKFNRCVGAGARSSALGAGRPRCVGLRRRFRLGRSSFGCRRSPLRSGRANH